MTAVTEMPRRHINGAMPLNLNHLRIFQAVLEQGSITGAAAALHISQPAVSRQLAEFESVLGTKLVDRLPRGIRPTAAGEMLGERARRIFAEEAAAELDIGEFLGLHRGRLAVGASTTVGGYLLPQVFGDFAERHPAIAIELAIGNTRAIQNDVIDGRLDLGLTEGFADSEMLESEVFLYDEMVLIAGTTGDPLAGATVDPLAGAVAIDAADLQRVPYLVREAGSGSREVIGPRSRSAASSCGRAWCSAAPRRSRTRSRAVSALRSSRSLPSRSSARSGGCGSCR
jgi:DNA-binding transcriptional LysR family regulator